MTSDAKLVAIGISEVGAIVVGVVLRPQAGLAITSAATLDSNCVNLIDLFARCSKERNHLAVAGMMLLPIMWVTNQE